MRELENPSDLLTAMNVLDSICKSVESFNREADFWRVLDEVSAKFNNNFDVFKQKLNDSTVTSSVSFSTI